jgi:hypothetical protein
MFYKKSVAKNANFCNTSKRIKNVQIVNVRLIVKSPLYRINKGIAEV